MSENSKSKFISLTCETVPVNNTLKALKAVTFKACELFSAYIDEPYDKYIVLPVSGVM